MIWWLVVWLKLNIQGDGGEGAVRGGVIVDAILDQTPHTDLAIRDCPASVLAPALFRLGTDRDVHHAGHSLRFDGAGR
jgi:hypothetical protein